MTGPLIAEGVVAAEGLPALLAAIAHRDAVVRRRARNSLIAVGRPAVEALVELLGDRRTHVRWEAAKALGAIGDPRAAPALVTALEADEDFDVRWVTGQALTALGREGLRAVLAALAARPHSTTLQEGAYHVCHRLSQRQAFRIVLPVLAALRSLEPELLIPATVRRALEQLTAVPRTKPK
jgi:HEAT repeat protein